MTLATWQWYEGVFAGLAAIGLILTAWNLWSSAGDVRALYKLGVNGSRRELAWQAARNEFARLLVFSLMALVGVNAGSLPDNPVWTPTRVMVYVALYTVLIYKFFNSIMDRRTRQIVAKEFSKR